jgi:hypothetical protein
MSLKVTLSKYSGKPSKLFIKILVALSFAYLPFLLLFLILVSFGLMPVNFNNENIYGLKGVAVLVCFASFLVFMFSAFAYLWFLFGYFVLQLFLHFYQIKNHRKKTAITSCSFYSFQKLFKLLFISICY